MTEEERYLDLVEKLDYWAEHDYVAGEQDLVDILNDAADAVDRLLGLMS